MKIRCFFYNLCNKDLPNLEKLDPKASDFLILVILNVYNLLFLFHTIIKNITFLKKCNIKI